MDGNWKSTHLYILNASLQDQLVYKVNSVPI